MFWITWNNSVAFTHKKAHLFIWKYDEVVRKYPCLLNTMTRKSVGKFVGETKYKASVGSHNRVNLLSLPKDICPIDVKRGELDVVTWMWSTRVSATLIEYFCSAHFWSACAMCIYFLNWSSVICVLWFWVSSQTRKKL